MKRTRTHHRSWASDLNVSSGPKKREEAEMPGLFALLLRAKTVLESYCMDLSPLIPKMFA